VFWVQDTTPGSGGEPDPAPLLDPPSSGDPVSAGVTAAPQRWSDDDPGTTWAPAPPPAAGMWPAPGGAGTGRPEADAPAPSGGFGTPPPAGFGTPTSSGLVAAGPGPGQQLVAPQQFLAGASADTGEAGGNRPRAGVTQVLRLRPAQWIAVGAGAAVAVGSVLPFVSYGSSSPLVTFQVHPTALAASAVFGLILVGLVVATRSARLRAGACLLLLVLGLLGFCGYMVFTVLGLTSGITPNGVAGQLLVVHWSPGPGIVLCIIGSAVCAFQSTMILRGSD